MFSIGSFILAVLIVFAVIGAGAAVLWLVVWPEEEGRGQGHRCDGADGSLQGHQLCGRYAEEDTVRKTGP